MNLYRWVLGTLGKCKHQEVYYQKDYSTWFGAPVLHSNRSWDQLNAQEIEFVLSGGSPEDVWPRFSQLPCDKKCKYYLS